MNFDNLNIIDGKSMNRQNWEFEYTAGVLADAALKKKEYRESRAAWWQEQQEIIMSKIKSDGLTITESVAAKYNTSATYGPELSIDPELKKKLAECHEKIREHLAAVRDYDGWFQVLNGNKESRVQLKHNDWLFFFAENS